MVMLKQFALFLLIPTLYALPTGPLPVHGEIHCSQQDNRLTITATDQSILEWREFSIEPGESTRFALPQDTSIILNRVTGSSPSRIFGQLESNGKIVLINPHGVLFGPDSKVDVSSLIASTLDLQNDVFLSGKEMHYFATSSSHISQQGKITCRLGDLILLSSKIETNGSLEAIEGAVACLAAQSAIHKESGFSVTQLSDVSEILHTGEIHSKSVYLIADQIALEGQSLIDVSAPFGGGSVYIGGGFQGKNPDLLNARNISISPDSQILANCDLNGNGGRIILWADQVNNFEGFISAQGGKEKGDGGFVEVSSPRLLSYRGKADLRALNGSYGMLLLDPTNISINTNPTTGGVVIANPSTIPPVATVDINNVDLTNQLNLSSVLISTAGAGPSLGDISVSAPIGVAPVWAANTSLTLEANRNITVTADINAAGTFAGDQLVLIADVNNTGIGDCIFTTPIPGPIAIDVADGGIRLEGNNVSIITNLGQVNITCLGAANGMIREIAANDITFLTSPVTNGASIRILTNRSFEAYAGRDCLIQTGAGGNNQFELVTTTGPQTYIAGRNLSLIGCVAPPFIGPNSYILLNSASDLILSAGENIIGNPNNVNATGGSSGQLSIMLSNANPASTTQLYALNSILLVNGPSFDNGVFFSNTFIFGPSPTYGNVDLRAGADIIIGTSINRSGGGMFPPNPDPTNTVYIYADHLFSPGQAWTALPFARLAGTILGSPSPIVSTTTGKVGGDGLGAFAIPSAYFQESTSILSGIDITTIDGDITIKSADRFDSGSIADFLIADRLTLINGLLPANIQSTTGNITVDPFHDVTIANVMATAGNVLVIVQNTMHFTSTGGINGGGTVTLVVDNAFPSSPLVGPGAFLMDAGSSITSGGLLTIYTARQQQNSVFGILNGVPFTPGTPYIDTALEQWCLYYPTPLPGIPYTISYKDCFGPTVLQATIIVDEFLVDLHPYNEFPGWMARFWVDYASVLDPNDFSSVSPEVYLLRRRNLNVINHPKSWTVLEEDSHESPRKQ